MKPLNLLAATLIGAAALPASAAQFDFYKLGRGAGDFLASNGQACTGGDWCSSNVNGSVFSGTLSFSDGGITANATANYFGRDAAVVQDHEPGWTASKGAGLGVYHSKITSDDNITSGEMLTITFDQVVQLSSIGLRAEGHNFTNWAAGDTFLFNGVSTLLPDNVGAIATSMTGQQFTFAFGGAQANEFYLSSMTVSAVPEPESYALMLAGMAVIGFVMRRRMPRA